MRKPSFKALKQTIENVIKENSNEDIKVPFYGEYDPIQHHDPPTKPGDSEALSSAVGTRFDLIPRVFLERVANRFALGAEKYPPFNYAKGLSDKKYIIDRINHLQAHLTAFLWPVSNEEWNDDNLAAIGWAVAFLMMCDTNVLNGIRDERSAVNASIEY